LWRWPRLPHPGLLDDI
jgi:hypothetical protein